MGLNCRSADIEYVHDDIVIKLPQELNISADKFAEIQVNLNARLAIQCSSVDRAAIG